MKKLKLKLILLFSILSLPAFGQGTLRTNVTLFWNYDPRYLTNMTFVVRGSPTPTGPATNWPIVATLSGVTNAPTPTNVTINLMPQEFFFICQAYNFWSLRLSDPSNVASTPPPPRSDVSLGVR